MWWEWIDAPVFGLIGVALTYAVNSRRWRRVADRATALQDQTREVAEDAVRDFRELKDVCRAAEGQLLEERARAHRYFRCIQTIERERNEWREAYEKSVSGHLAAQNMMLGEIGRLGRVMHRTKAALEHEPPQVELALRYLAARPREDLQSIRDAFQTEHEALPGHIDPAELDLTPAEQAERQGAPSDGEPSPSP